MAVLAPTSSAERIHVLDITRGIAVLGILLLNITAFGLPFAYEDPTNWGGHEGKDLVVWRLASLFFEGSMRGLFTLLFGAGVVLFLQRHRSRDPNGPTALLYYRRTVCLILFGLIDSYLFLWDGDILVYYGVVGLILYFFSKLSPRALMLSAALVVAVQTGVTVVEYERYCQMREAAAAVQQMQRDAAARTWGEHITLTEHSSIEHELKPSRSQLQYTVDTVRESYASALRHVAQRVSFTQTSFFVRHGFADVFSFMLLGMALIKMGVLTGAAPRRVYAWMAFAGYTLGLTVNAFETVSYERSGFSVDMLMRSYLTYDLGRLPMTLGHLGTIMLIHRYGLFTRAQQVLAAVGRMALTNYLAQSVICMFLFTGAGLALYGQLDRHELYYVVLAIWLAQLLWSPLWLGRVRFGPAEWLWRKMTYLRL